MFVNFNKGEKTAGGATLDSPANGCEVIGPQNSGASKFSNGNSDVIVSIDNVQSIGLNRKFTYVQAYMKFMYWTCICPFNPMENDEAGDTTTLCKWMLNFLQKVSYFILLFKV